MNLPNETALDPNLDPAALGVLVHLLACEECYTHADLVDHGFGRAATRTALNVLERHGYYGTEKMTRSDGDEVLLVHLASKAGQFAPPVCVSRVYFIQRGDLIKVGTTTRLPQRLRELEREGGPVSLLGALAGGAVLEQQLHRRFQKHLVKSEWFNDCKDIRDYIEEMGLIRTVEPGDSPLYEVLISHPCEDGEQA